MPPAHSSVARTMPKKAAAIAPPTPVQPSENTSHHATAPPAPPQTTIAKSRRMKENTQKRLRELPLERGRSITARTRMRPTRQGLFLAASQAGVRDKHGRGAQYPVHHVRPAARRSPRLLWSPASGHAQSRPPRAPRRALRACLRAIGRMRPVAHVVLHRTLRSKPRRDLESRSPLGGRHLAERVSPRC